VQEAGDRGLKKGSATAPHTPLCSCLEHATHSTTVKLKLLPATAEVGVAVLLTAMSDDNCKQQQNNNTGVKM
jgi:hypothetical protein